jgi:large subunit ribosomal protein L9
MKVILNQNVENVGSVGDVVKVSDGFARNYLIPQGWAATATEANIRVIALKQAKAIEAEKEARGKAEEIAKRARTLQIAIEATVGDDGKLFGSVTSSEIVDKLAELGITIDKKHVRVPKAIRKVGSHDIELRMYHNVRALLKVVVTAKKGSVKEAKQPKEAKAAVEEAVQEVAVEAKSEAKPEKPAKKSKSKEAK